MSERIEEAKDAVRIFDVAFVSDVRRLRIPTSDFDAFPMYQLVSDGVIKENQGRMKYSTDILFYDVTKAPEEFKEVYGSIVSELNVRKIIGAKKQQSEPENAARITTLMRLDGVYSALDKSDIQALGKDYVVVQNTEEGIKVVPVIRATKIPENMCLRLDGRHLSEELLTKISGDIIELSEKSNGLYQESSISSTEKQI